MKSNEAQRSMVEVSQTVRHRTIAGSRFSPRSPRRSEYAESVGPDPDGSLDRLEMEPRCHQRTPLPRQCPHLLRAHRHPKPSQEQLHVVARPKLMPRFTRFQVLRIIKLATMDKLRESGASGADDPTRQRLATEGAGGDGGAARGSGKGEGGSDEYHHQFYNTGRIGRRNALPDILGTHCTTTTADLSSQLGALSTSECAGKPADGSAALSSSIAPPESGQTPTTTGT